MVLYYTTRDSSYKVYVGKDKYENEDLLKHGWEQDVWFHVDKVSCPLWCYVLHFCLSKVKRVLWNIRQDEVQLLKIHCSNMCIVKISHQLSSAHVYLRLHDGDTIESIPPGVLEDCAQLVKHNSIEGNKQSNVPIVYTMWSNLKKTGDMAVGQVSFHSNQAVRRITVEKRINEIVNRLNKTKREEFPDLGAEKREHLRKMANSTREKERRERKEALALAEQRRKEKEAKSYDSIHKSTAMTSNRDFRQDANDFEDGFM